jgi:MFS superfamily sulfate permease-like transporter
MDLKVTLAGLAVTAGLMLFAGWRGARPPDFLKGPRMAPWRPLMVAFATAFLILLVHLVNLLGITTGQTRP